MLECLALLCLSPVALPVQPFAPARIQSDSEASQTLWIRSDRIIVRPGTEISGALIVQDGRIVAVGPGLTAPEGAQQIEGAVVCAGYLDAWSTVGVFDDTVQDAKLDSASRVVDGLDTHGFAKERMELLQSGVTTLRVQGGVEAEIGGVCAIVRNDPNANGGDVSLLADACVAATIGVTTGNKVPDVFDRIGNVDKLVRLIEGGRSYVDRLAAYETKQAEWEKAIEEKSAELEKDFKKAKKKREGDKKKAEEKDKEYKEKKYKEDKPPKPVNADQDKAVMGRVEAGEMPLVVEIHRAAEIRELLLKTAEFSRLRLILAGATEAAGFAKELAERNISVIVWPTPMGVNRPDEYKTHDLELAGKLQAAGVNILFGSGGEASPTDLSALAAIAVGHGLDRNAALEALTIGAARSFDVADQIGTVERGKEADLLILTGDPLDVTTRTSYVILDGVIVVQP
ncbi:MAG: imidazolonepropionase-like amidohydrolase [Planctomycetota bacterium]|jgi:imidazolonepropionase-like amidohydrolase